MAKKPTRKKPTARPTPMLAQEKEARAAGIAATVASVDANVAQVASRTRGAYAQRRLRQSGTDLSRYNVGGYKDDKFPKLPTPPGGGTGTRTSTRTRTTTKPKGKQHGIHYTDKEKQKLQQDLSDARGREMERIARRKAAERKAAQAAARKAAARKAKARGVKGGRTRSTTPPKTTTPAPGSGGRARAE